MTTIQVKVADKVASVIGSPAIICGNSDYSIGFNFDKEWETYDVKTARFVYKKNGSLQFIDVVFTGALVAVPILSGIDEVYLGVYAGELRTTTPARIICERSILCLNSEKYEEPDPDVYQQLLELIRNKGVLPTVTEAEAGKSLMVAEDGHWVVRLHDYVHNQNNGELIRFFFGTYEEWNAWTGDKNNLLFVPTNCTILEEIEEEFKRINAELEKIKKGETIVPSATKASEAESYRDEGGTLHNIGGEFASLFNGPKSVKFAQHFLLTPENKLAATGTDVHRYPYVNITKAGLYAVSLIATGTNPANNSTTKWCGTGTIFIPNLDFPASGTLEIIIKTSTGEGDAHSKDLAFLYYDEAMGAIRINCAEATGYNFAVGVWLLAELSQSVDPV